jgi:hypothetical protein
MEDNSQLLKVCCYKVLNCARTCHSLYSFLCYVYVCGFMEPRQWLYVWLSFPDFHLNIHSHLCLTYVIVLPININMKDKHSLSTAVWVL